MFEEDSDCGLPDGAVTGYFCGAAVFEQQGGDWRMLTRDAHMHDNPQHGIDAEPCNIEISEPRGGVHFTVQSCAKQLQTRRASLVVRDASLIELDLALLTSLSNRSSRCDSLPSVRV